MPAQRLRYLRQDHPTFLKIICSVALVVSPMPPASAKDVPVTGVFLFDGPSGPAYVQVTGFLVNGKTEMRACAGTGPIDKNGYKNLAKVNLASIRSIERQSDGSLTAEEAAGPPICVVPGNFKFDKEAALSPSDLVDRSVFAGTVLASTPDGQKVLPPFGKGTAFVFGSATDKDFAEFLRAHRAASIPMLKDYLGAYGTSPNAAQARQQLSTLLNTEGAAKLAAYRKTSKSPNPAFDDLNAALKDADQSLNTLPGNDPASKLARDVQTELTVLADQAGADLKAYRDALDAHTAGYARLVDAQRLSAAITTIDPKYPPGLTVAANVRSQSTAHDAAVQTAEANVHAQNIEGAVRAITPFKSLAPDDPRVSQVLDELYKYYIGKGTSGLAEEKWEDASKQFHAAYEIRPTDEAKTKIASAEASLLASRNKAAADRALSTSQTLVAEPDPIRAYEVLAELPDGPRSLVKNQMAALQAAYITAAALKAQQLQQTHTPIRGRADEDAVRQAFAYYERINSLTSDDDMKIKQELLADIISSYYVDLGKKYLGRPLSSGVGIGFGFLTEAQQYRQNLDQVRDEMTKNGAAYQMRARLSIGVVFRDQTSRRDSAGFTDQMQQAFATGIETSGLPAKVILPGSGNTLEPNFQFVGEILQHRTTRNVKKETLRSEYRSGSREIPNEAWNKADLEFEAETMALQKDQAALTAAQAKNNKKLIESLSAGIADREKTVQQARAKMNSTPKTLSEPIISPYNYTQTTLELTNIVELSFRILDATGGTIQGPTRVVKGEKPHTFILLENLKSDDTKGIKEVDAPPDEAQLMTDIEIEARDTMVKAAHDKVLELPAQVFAKAQAKAAGGDNDSAGELYVLYLNSTPAGLTPERQQAAQFLSANFNIRHAMALSATLQ